MFLPPSIGRNQTFQLPAGVPLQAQGGGVGGGASPSPKGKKGVEQNGLPKPLTLRGLVGLYGSIRSMDMVWVRFGLRFEGLRSTVGLRLGGRLTRGPRIGHLTVHARSTVSVLCALSARVFGLKRLEKYGGIAVWRNASRESHDSKLRRERAVRVRFDTLVSRDLRLGVLR